MKVSATLKGRKDAHGRMTVTLRIAEGPSRKFQATHIRVRPDQFNKGFVKSAHPDHVQLNHKILQLIMDVERAGGFTEKESITFYSYADSLIKKWANTKAYDTLRHYRSALNKFNSFRPGIGLDKIDKQVLEDYADHCYAEGLTGNSVWNTLKFMRLIILRAIKDEKITHNPFLKYEMPKYRDPKRHFLTEAQIAAIDKVRNNKSTPENLCFAATWFLIGIYSGLRYSDMAHFDRSKNIKDGRLIVYTVKTGAPIGMPVNRQLKQLFESIDYKPMVYTNVHFNRLMKLVAAMAGIKETLTIHNSRHTFAMRLANSGVSQEVTSKLLGHNKLTTTSIYYKISNKRIDDELKKLS